MGFTALLRGLQELTQLSHTEIALLAHSCEHSFLPDVIDTERFLLLVRNMKDALPASRVSPTASAVEPTRWADTRPSLFTVAQLEEQIEEDEQAADVRMMASMVSRRIS